MRKYSLIVLCLLFFTLMVGCVSCSKSPSGEKTGVTDVQITVQPNSNRGPGEGPELYAFITSDPGGVTVHGILLVLEPANLRPDADDGIFLVSLDGEGEGATTIPPFEVGEVPQADVNEITGEFVFVNVQPGQYAVVVLTAGGGQIPVRKYDDGNLAIFTIDETNLGKTVELNYLTLP